MADAKLEPKIDIRERAMVEIYIRDSSEYARVQFREDEGWVNILSSYGNWGYSGWWNRGDCSMSQFLAGVHSDYAGSKFLGATHQVFDPDGSIRAVREHILECRREAGIRCVEERDKYGPHFAPRHPWEEKPWTKERAREEWETAALIEYSFGQWYAETDIDGYDWAHQTKVEPQWCGFWERLWVPLVRPALKRQSLATTIPGESGKIRVALAAAIL